MGKLQIVDSFHSQKQNNETASTFILGTVAAAVYGQKQAQTQTGQTGGKLTILPRPNLTRHKSFLAVVRSLHEARKV